jgi:pimeloyl-ACP methyl ester carboxylesterase
MSPSNSSISTVTSADGTAIAFEPVGRGPVVILVGGAFNDRTTVTGLARVLSSDFTVIVFDRRGRGDSGDTPPYAVQREVEDIAALISHVGGSVGLFGHSSGAILALEATVSLPEVEKLAVYEPPFVVDDTRPQPAPDLLERLQALVDEDRRADAATLFLTEGAGVPSEVVAEMRGSQMWGWFTGLAHTLPYDVAICGPANRLPAHRYGRITAPTLAIGGGTSPGWMRSGTRAVAEAVPGGRYLTLEGHDHSVLNQPEALGPILRDFLKL